MKNIIQDVAPSITLPDNSFLVSDQQGRLPISSILSKTAQQIKVLSHLKSSSLVSLVQLCDDNCKSVTWQNKCICGLKQWSDIKWIFKLIRWTTGHSFTLTNTVDYKNTATSPKCSTLQGK